MKRKQAPVFSIAISDTDNKTGVNLISFVSNPAIEADFVALSAAQKVQLATDKMKQVLTGPVLIPDKQILRVDEEGNPFYITFSADTIEQIRNKFHKDKHTHATNDEHAVALDGNYVVESWLIADAEKDKAVALGLEGLPVGTWMVSYHVPDADYWEKEVLSGNKRGFSLEGFFEYEEIKEQLSKIDMPKAITPKKPGLIARMKALFSALLLSVLTLEDGTEIQVDDETKEVFKTDENGERGEVLADGSYTLSDGTTITVKEGKLSEEAPAAEEEELEATTLADGTYALPGGDVLSIVDGTYAIEKAGESEGGEGTSLSAQQVQLSDITLEDGTIITHDPISKKLYKGDAILESGTYKTADGQYFKVSTDQWWYETQETLMSQVQELSTKLSAANQEKATLQAKLAKKPAAQPVKLGGDKGSAGEATESKTRGQQRFESLKKHNA